MHDSILNGPIQTVKWEWQSNQNPWSTAEAQKWTLYSKEHTLALEKGFQQKKRIIETGDCDVYLESWIQIHRRDAWKVARVRRVEMTGRTQYFCSELSTPKNLNQMSYTGNPPIIDKWLKGRVLPFRIDKNGYNITKEKDMPALRETVELACRGILGEGMKGDWETLAEIIVKRLRDSINKHPEGIFRECIYAYTEQNNIGPVSLYSVVNNTLREDNLDKINILGPFCYLLHFALKNLSLKGSIYFHAGHVYRGVVLDNEMLERYRKTWKKGLLISFPSFVSTSKDISITEKFKSVEDKRHKVLLNIKVSGGVYIEALTSQHGEEEVLLPACRAFKILDIQEGEIKTIFLEMVDTELSCIGPDNDQVILMSESLCSQLRSTLSEFSQGKNISFEIDRRGENITPPEKAANLSKLVTQAAEGIKNCGSRLGRISENEGTRISRDLINTIQRSPMEIFKVILKWYTHESFLGKEIDKCLKQKDPQVLQDLEAYMYLLSLYFIGLDKVIRSHHMSTQKELDMVYYSVSMSRPQIAIFEELNLKNLQFAFPSFLWVSSNRELTECDIKPNSNQDQRISVLYNIAIPKEIILLFTMKKYSVFPDEDDVLLPPNFNFKVVEIQKGPNNKIIEVFLKFVDYVV